MKTEKYLLIYQHDEKTNNHFKKDVLYPVISKHRHLYSVYDHSFYNSNGLNRFSTLVVNSLKIKKLIPFHIETIGFAFDFRKTNFLETIDKYKNHYIVVPTVVQTTICHKDKDVKDFNMQKLNSKTELMMIHEDDCIFFSFKNNKEKFELIEL